MKIEVVVWNGKEWVVPPLLDEPKLQRAANAAAVLDVSVVKAGALSFDEGAGVCLLADGKMIFKGRVFEKQRTQPEIIKVRAYDQLRYLQNRDSCVFSNFTVADMLRRIAADMRLTLGDVANCGLVLGVRTYDNRRYLDMLTEVLQEVLQAKERHYFLFDEGGRLCLRSCRNMQVNILLDLSTIGSYNFATSLDDDFYNRIKVIYEDKRKGLRRQFVAEDTESVAKRGVLQYVSKSATAETQTLATAQALLRTYCKRTDSLTVSGAVGDIDVRGGSMVGLRLALGDRIYDGWVLVKNVVHYFRGGKCLMDLDLDITNLY